MRGQMYRNGAGRLGVDPDKHICLWRLATDQQAAWSAYAAYDLALLLDRISTTVAEFLERVTQAAELGEPRAEHDRGNLQDRKFRPAAGLYPLATCNAGLMYMPGEGVPWNNGLLSLQLI